MLRLPQYFVSVLVATTLATPVSVGAQTKPPAPGQPGQGQPGRPGQPTQPGRPGQPGQPTQPGQEEEPEEPTTPPPDVSDPNTTARRPYRAVFGGASVDPNQSYGLRFDGSAFGVWDDNLLADISGPGGATTGVRGGYANVLGDVTYMRRSSRTHVTATGGANGRYYTSLNRFAANDLHIGGGIDARTSRATSVAVNQSLSYAPVFLFGLFANALPQTLGTVSSPNSVYAVADDRALTTDSRFEFEYQPNVRQITSARAAYRRSDFVVDLPRGSGFTSYEGGADHRYRVTENTDFRLGYFYRRAYFEGVDASAGLVPQPTEHNIQLGLSFHPQLSNERRTIVTFEGGTALVQAALPTNVFETRRQLRLVGDLSLVHQMGQTWLLTGAYRRGTGIIQGLNGPVFVDAVSLSTSGFMNRRTDFVGSLSYSTGEPTVVGGALNFKTFTALARLRVALGPRVALTSEYVFYHYDFSAFQPLIFAGIDPRVSRNTLRAGINVWWPLAR